MMKFHLFINRPFFTSLVKDKSLIHQESHAFRLMGKISWFYRI